MHAEPNATPTCFPDLRIPSRLILLNRLFPTWLSKRRVVWRHSSIYNGGSNKRWSDEINPRVRPEIDGFRTRFPLSFLTRRSVTFFSIRLLLHCYSPSLVPRLSYRGEKYLALAEFNAVSYLPNNISALSNIAHIPRIHPRAHIKRSKPLARLTTVFLYH